MDTFMEILSLVLKALILYTTVIGFFCVLPRKKLPRREAATRFAVLLAARNEEAVIGSTVASLLRQNYPPELFDVFVIPNNCTDDTAGAAEAAGAKIFTCLAPVHNKGDVLQQAMAALQGKGYDAFCVFDADNLIDPDFLARMNDAVLSGARAAKGKQKSLNPGDSWVAGCYDIYRENFDLLHSRARGNIGLSAKLMGTGFVVTCELMEELGGWHTETITEDTEFAAQLAQAGVQIKWVPEAISYDEEPVSFRQSMTQRKRWCSGVLEVGRKMIPKLWYNALSFGNFRAADFALFLTMPYTQVLMLLPGAWGIWNTLQTQGWFFALTLSFIGFYAGLVLTAFALALIGRRPLKTLWKSILLYPVFTASWLPLHVLGVFHKTTVWRPIVHNKTRKNEVPSTAIKL